MTEKGYLTKNKLRQIVGMKPVINSAISNPVLTTKFVDAEGLKYFKKEFEKQLMEKLAVVPTFEHKCNNCGGTLEMKVDEHIFKCQYCGSVYAIGTAMMEKKKIYESPNKEV